MALSSLPIVLVLAAVATLVIVRQFQDRPLRLWLLLGVPAALVLLGGRPLFTSRESTASDIVLTFDVALALVFGIWRGWSFRVWRDQHGEPRRQGTRLTLALWLSSILARGALTAVGRAAGAGKNASYQALPFMLGATLLAQSAVILWRAAQLAPATAET
jgi:hypothetical protein